MYCDQIYDLLKAFNVMLRAWINPIDATIDITRSDTAKLLESRDLEEWIPSYGTGAIYCIQKKREVVGDVAVPSSIEDKKVSEINKIKGCRIDYIHRYETLGGKPAGVTHIHFTCKKAPIEEIVKLLGE